MQNTALTISAKTTAASPMGLTVTHCSNSSSKDGAILGLNSAKTYGYKISADTEYYIVENDTSITGLGVGTYQVRFEESDEFLESMPTSITIAVRSSGGGGSGGGSTVTTKPEVPKPEEVKPVINKPKLPEYPKLPAKDFSDVPQHWAKDDIYYLSTKGIIDGGTDGKFRPDDKVTRGQFVKILAAIAGVDKESYKTTSFKDVKSTDWYAPFVAWANDKGITTGVGDDMFKPNEMISREQMAVMLTRLLTVVDYKLEVKKEETTFSDSEVISPYAKDAVEILQTGNIVGGKEDNTFAPKESASRAEAATMIARLLKTMTNE